MSKQYEPELGQAVFGTQSWADYETPDFVDALLEHIFSEIDRVYWNINQKEWGRYEDPLIPDIEFHPYYWGECTCGFEELVGKWEDENKHRDYCYQQDYEWLSKKYNYLIPDIQSKKLCAKHNIPWNNGQGCAIHCTCDYEKKWRAFCEQNNHKSDCPTVQPNFKFGKAEIRWYKHSGRGQNCNVNWNEKQWREWFDDCIKRIQQYERKQMPDIYDEENK